jgi:lipopolysaccharide/colanic/teichoic acid biosynthesis glycosyltransferase
MATFPITEEAVYLPPARKVSAHGRRTKQRRVGEILEEHHFLYMLGLERKRTERSSKPFMLLLLSARPLFQSSSGEKVIRQIASAISSSTRDTDSVGWYEWGSTLAVLFTEIGSTFENSKVICEKIATALEEALEPEHLEAIKINFRVFPSRSGRKDDDDDTDLVFYPDVSHRRDPRKRGARFVKRGIDILGSLILLTALWPVLLVIALLVKTTSEGPVLFRQRRIGEFGAVFTFLKFRSMFQNNDPKIHQEYVARLIQGKAEAKQSADGKAVVYKLTNDPRVTQLGRFLRRTSLDELPQLVNVLIGDMSLVGPRPPLPYEFEQYDIWHRRRMFEVKPGITGLWQVMGRSRTTFDEMVRLDLKYAKTWSIRMDLKILLQTPMAVISGEGAH